MCDPHRTHEEDKKHGFPGLDLKTGGNSLMLNLKITAIFSWFRPQN
jgi:hypothetical protein